MPSKHQPIFIIGAPRTGSTIFYQALTNYYQVSYINNLASFFYEHLPFGMWLSQKIFNYQPHHNFEAKHGDTLQYGLNAPSECGAFWYRWFPQNTHHFVEADDIEVESIVAMRDEIYSIMANANQSMVFKNLNAGQRLRVLSQAFPEAKIIVIRRDPRFTINSILKARKKVGMDEHEIWSVKPKNHKDLEQYNEGEMCAGQVFYLEKQIEEDIRLFKKENFYTVHYQDFSENLIKAIGAKLQLARKPNGKLPTFKKDSENKLTEEELKALTQYSQSQPFDSISFINQIVNQ